MAARAALAALRRGAPLAAALALPGGVLLAACAPGSPAAGGGGAGAREPASWTAAALAARPKGGASAAHPPLALADTFDVAIVGGGIIGLATAREVRRRFPALSVAVLEKEREVAAHQTGHNSGVIHAGMYYTPGSVMAKTCVRGAALMYAFCAEKGVPHARVGKLIVATRPEEHALVEKLFHQGVANGVQGLRVLAADEVRAMEPAIAAHSALWSPNTGVVDYGAVARVIAEELLASGKADIKFSFEARDFTVAGADGDRFVTIAGLEPDQRGPTKHVRARHVITCAGLHADRVAAAAGGAPKPRISTFRGTYYQMKPEFTNVVKTNVYPTPSGGGIPVGVHFTPTVNERRGHAMIVGPGACPTFSREGYRFGDVSLRDVWDTLTTRGMWMFALKNPDLAVGELWRDLNKRAFLRSAQRLMPALREDMVEPSFAGVMAQVFEDDGSASKDYIFERRCLDGTTLHVRNAPSPAATASLAIAEHIVTTASTDFGWGAPPRRAN